MAASGPPSAQSLTRRIFSAIFQEVRRILQQLVEAGLVAVGVEELGGGQDAGEDLALAGIEGAGRSAKRPSSSSAVAARAAVPSAMPAPPDALINQSLPRPMYPPQ